MTYVAPDVAEPPRPPPKRRRWIGTPGVLWYRDQAIRRLLFQVIFLVAVAAGIYLAFSNLVNNLGESNIVIDFGVFKRPFGTSVAEGPRIDTEWQWLQDPSVQTSPYWWAWAAFWLYMLYGYVKEAYGPKKDTQRAAMIGAVGVILLLIQPFLLNWLFQELIPYLAPRANTRVLYSGFINTLRVVIASVVASTILGILAGIGLLSRNFLVRNITMIYVEIFRNTPLYVQLLFVYTTLLIILPDSIANSIRSPEKISLPFGLGSYTLYEKLYSINTIGLSFAVPRGTSTVPILWGALGLGAVISYLVRRWRLQQQDLTGAPAKTLQFVGPIMLVAAVAGWLLAGGYPLGDGPFRMDYLTATRFTIEGGYTITLFFFAISLGLTLYTAAFIADIVRAGIQAVPYGQVEAARAHGLSNTQVLSLVILPQALRLIIPPLGNQYVNMGKNSSLAIAVGFMDLYLLANVVNNESGQAVPIFMGLLVIYLFLSLMLSLLTNLMNSFAQLRTR
jgi:general L-amino acid transport system permease protein